jgi:hypothetical protein
VADEFPTLEVALAALTPWLIFRGLALGQNARRASADLDGIAVALESGHAESSSVAGRSSKSAWLTPIRRLAAQASAGESVTVVRHQLTERAERIERSLRSAAARDLVVCAVLDSALVYGYASNLGVAVWFYVFGVANTTLLALAVAFRLQMASALGRATPRLLAALGTHGAARPSDGGGSRCRHCGSTNVTRVANAAELGAALSTLGVEFVSVCQSCGHIAGRAKPDAATLAGPS